MSDKIIYPTIDLFLYDLKDGLGEDEEKINQNCQQFCHKIYGDLDEENFQEKYKQIKKHKNIQADVIELLETQVRDFPSPLDGYYYPLQLGDTYALQVDYSGKLEADGKPNDDEQDLNNKPFQKLKEGIKEYIFQQAGTIGQTWLLWGKLTENKQDDEIEKIAQECYTQVVSNYDWKRDFIGKGSLLGGTVFELWYCPENLGLSGKEFWKKFRQESHHILIWLFPYNQSPDKMRKTVKALYYDLQRLWQYRHKIVWAYYQSRYQKSLLKQEYVETQPAIYQASQLPKELQTNSLKLSQLQEILTTNLINLSDYTIALTSLENLSHTIKVNLENYQFRLENLNQHYSGSKLEFLKEFSSETYAQKYQRQLQTDHASLSPGLTLLQNLNSTIQGIIELEQTKSDRALNNTIAVAGFGLATSGIAVTILIEQYPPPKETLFLQTRAFWGSLLAGAIAVIILWGFLRLIRR
ncbi:MAG: hypothetical protein F6K58_11490 [Symploca sp. SIO2E9]|nr:hypothetical protein [Symploca sp. SIO2E9]